MMGLEQHPPVNSARDGQKGLAVWLHLSSLQRQNVEDTLSGGVVKNVTTLFGLHHMRHTKEVVYVVS